ncbi:hypothetical protein [Flavobacterium tibetense]|jgi:hypothetical protein|uniref:Uncharacterized protein n=1 Tax=Flavobacterium tibetense TaxID=2233533 RepID=A0A365P2Z8_9FLAO|nr:hypothetical protein [Flavobacterium tibetense]RBA28885.1 hypothetical protein DPN68_05730 [Flavobacterium tibetense]
METTKKISLIEGNYSPSEAKEMLLDLYHKNINFNKVKNFSSQIRFGEDDKTAVENIENLTKAVNYLNQLLKDAQAENKNLVIKSVIEIAYENELQTVR